MPLVLVPTPIGNLEDITLRALRTLREANLILAEDTRKTGILLKHFEIQSSMQSYHIHNEHQIVANLIERLRNEEHIALVTDAGTPGISDPGFLLIRECIRHDVSVSCLPGPVAFIPALVASGLPTDCFLFAGFLPHKKGRKPKIEELAQENKTVILYESPHRLVKALLQLAEACGPERPAAVSRELTKIHEETRRGTLAELHEHYSSHPPKGEIVICVSGIPKNKKD